MHQKTVKSLTKGFSDSALRRVPGHFQCVQWHWGAGQGERLPLSAGLPSGGLSWPSSELGPGPTSCIILTPTCIWEADRPLQLLLSGACTSTASVHSLDPEKQRRSICLDVQCPGELQLPPWQMKEKNEGPLGSFKRTCLQQRMTMECNYDHNETGLS